MELMQLIGQGLSAPQFLPDLINDLGLESSSSANFAKLQPQRFKEDHGRGNDAFGRSRKTVTDYQGSTDPKINFPIPKHKKYKVWVGVVDELKEETVVVSFFDMGDRSIPRYQAEFDLNEYFKGDRKLLKEDTYVRWAIGYFYSLDDSLNSEDMKFSELSIIKFPQITESDLEVARRESKELFEGLFNNEAPK